tara:strand:- start:698 stop:868 length:171 start_codon:yes stop_codon:yes gene_type:complete
MPHRRKDDWRLWTNGWQYKKDAPHDEKWQKDRQELFRENGNGWWWFPQYDPKRTDI